jgi:hypothetical protein
MFNYPNVKSTTLKDDRTESQRRTHFHLVAAKDKFWRGENGERAHCVWACRSDSEIVWRVERWVRSRGDMELVRVTQDSPSKRRRFNNRNPADLVHIYVVDEGHPALSKPGEGHPAIRKPEGVQSCGL